MPTPKKRRLWTGPPGSALRDRALDDGPVDPLGIWIVPSPLARAQVIRALTLKRGSACRLRVWCWADLWAAVAEAHDDPPARLSAASTRAVLGEAIAQARRDDALGPIAGVVDLPGMQRRLRDRIAGWIRAERPPSAPPPAGDPSDAGIWAVYVRYRDALKRLGAEDGPGLANWASRALALAPSRLLGKVGRATVFDLEPPDPAAWRALEALRAVAGEMLVTLERSGDPGLAEADAASEPTRERLLGWGFIESSHAVDLWRPAGLRAIARDAFRRDADDGPRAESAEGLRVVGASEGEGLQLLLAREIRDRLDRGVDPAEVLVLVPRGVGNESRELAEALRRAGLPIAGVEGRPLASDPEVAALLLAANLPADDWDVSRLVRLLRNGRLRPEWPELAGTPRALAATASAIRATRVFRGREAIAHGLEQDARGPRAVGPPAERARVAVEAFARLGSLVDATARASPWRAQSGQLARLAAGLGLGESSALDAMFEALNDHAEVLDGLGQGTRSRPWSAFVGEVGAIARDLPGPSPASDPGGVAVLGVDEARGARAAHVVLANLAEGTFPSRSAVDPDSGADSEEGSFDSRYGREVARFLHVVGSAASSLVLAYPTTDLAGQDLLAASFLDDVLRLFDPSVAATFHESHRRFDPALLEYEDLARAPADARARSIALAVEGRGLDALRDLARSRRHRPALDGVSAALEVAHRRSQPDAFGPFDGRLADPDAVAEVARRFAADHIFSPSQLESFTFCPFQFYQKFVLKLEPVDETDELESDLTRRGTRLHKMLEKLEIAIGNATLEAGGDLLEVDRIEVKGILQAELDGEPYTSSAVVEGLREIEYARLGGSLDRYVTQRAGYLAGSEVPPTPYKFEMRFGDPLDEKSRLTLGSGPELVQIGGTIDRVDRVLTADGTEAFRVIDYKSGHAPGKADVMSALALQLPLYALAVERSESLPLADLGYWAMKSEQGYGRIKLDDWPAFARALEVFVVAQVDQLRRGVFAVDPRKRDDCGRFCDYRAVCRVGTLRSSGKRRDDAPSLEIAK